MTPRAETAPSPLETCETMLEASRDLLDRIIDRARKTTEAGRKIDDHQVLTRKLANLATRVEAARHTIEYARAYRLAQQPPDDMLDAATRIVVCETARDLLNE
ncbi:hypothetical protein IIC65_07105, partial [Candidatus Sumerlaeota bacterium]|nr:hypothetical protein [Candidatus Sumerlaeota bacterium]